jgi:hypothetical protein
MKASQRTVVRMKRMADLVRNGEGKCDQAQGPVWKRFEEKYAKAPAEATGGGIGHWPSWVFSRNKTYS